MQVDDHTAIASALREGGLEPGLSIAVIVGGPGGMDEATMAALMSVVRDTVGPALARHGAAVVDGGTDSGVLRLIG